MSYECYKCEWADGDNCAWEEGKRNVIDFYVNVESGAPSWCDLNRKEEMALCNLGIALCLVGLRAKLKEVING